jgi:hypothetical protein
VGQAQLQQEHAKHEAQQVANHRFFSQRCLQCVHVRSDGVERSALTPNGHHHFDHVAATSCGTFINPWPPAHTMIDRVSKSMSIMPAQPNYRGLGREMMLIIESSNRTTPHESMTPRGIAVSC